MTAQPWTPRVFGREVAALTVAMYAVASAPVRLATGQYRALLDDSAATPRSTQARASRGSAGDLAARRVHQLLPRASRLPGGTWHNSCLYRAVAECVARRCMGEDVHVAIGVRREPVTPNGVAAHAWLVWPGAAAPPSPDHPDQADRGFATLRAAGR